MTKDSALKGIFFAAIGFALGSVLSELLKARLGLIRQEPTR